ncbi:isochorismatase family protein [Pseudomonas cavernicola]|uniref:Isochorismatase family protein n=1 Tax=Pseudomonas cavernicola TaxID=2320866 RepID=A0A418XHY8_9PSED|nr:isochorismatase family protein [Pseudomonas cavernicola]
MTDLANAETAAVVPGRKPYDLVEDFAKGTGVLVSHGPCDLVVHIRHEFSTEDAPFFAPGSEGGQIHPTVLNRPDEPVVLKNYINSFRATDLKQVLVACTASWLTQVRMPGVLRQGSVTSHSGLW